MSNQNIRLVPLHEGFLCFTRDTDEEMARRVYTTRFHEEPEQVIDTGDMIRLGPVPEDEQN